MNEYTIWKSDEVDFRIIKTILTTLRDRELISAAEFEELQEATLKDLHPLIGLIEEDAL